MMSMEALAVELAFDFYGTSISLLHEVRRKRRKIQDLSETTNVQEFPSFLGRTSRIVESNHEQCFRTMDH